jgi:hypothetical protein
MAEKTKKTSLLMRFKGLLLIVLTGGLGGMEMSDYPILSRVVKYLQSDSTEAIADDALRSGIVTQIERVAAKKLDPYAREGTFDVKVERVSLSDVEYEAGRTIDLQVRVARVRGGRADAIVWDSRKLGPNKRVVGQDELTVGWAEKPFRVDWKPGDRYLLEVWDCSGRLKYTKLFVLDRTGRSDEFPLRPATVTLTLRADGEPTRDPNANELVVSGQPVGAERNASPDADRVADSGRDRR